MMNELGMCKQLDRFVVGYLDDNLSGDQQQRC